MQVKIHRIVLLPVVLYGCDTRSLTLREDHRVRGLREIFGPRRGNNGRLEKNAY
jgi:hypothetical protein